MSDEVLYCADLDQAIAVFMRLGLRLDTISPADDPYIASLSGHGEQVRLRRLGTGEIDPDVVPALRPAFVIARAEHAAWRAGRAGMRYRDLIPDRQGGRYIASHIRIEQGGPVCDYVHFHAIQLQLIYCYKGWVRVVYEDQGEPFVMHAGECVLQPPGIRHRVLEASPGLEVIEVATPAVHATHVEHELALPTPVLRPDRERGGQRFVRHLPGAAHFAPDRIAGLDACELGISAATSGLAAAHVLRAREPGDVTPPGFPRAKESRGPHPVIDPSPSVSRRRSYVHDAELWFHVVLRGEVTLDDDHRLGPADAFVIPAGRRFAWSHASPDLELLRVALPGVFALDPVAP
jgi:quercetin dioxygenase-like cupin family protein